MVINENFRRKIIPIGGGKGGVGKSLIAANLALQLAGNQKDTVVIDLDLGGSNLHTCLGLKNSNRGIGNFLSDSRMSFGDIIMDTPYENLRFVPGDVLVPKMANVQSAQKKRIISSILDLDADYIILDLGSGSHSNVIDFFLISNSGFLLTTPKTMSVLNAFEFLKNLVYRFMESHFATNKKISHYLRSTAKEKKPQSQPGMDRVVKHISGIDGKAGKKARNFLASLSPKLILNMASSPRDLEIAEKLRDLVSNTLKIDLECIGFIFSDETVNEAVDQLTPVSHYKEDSVFAVEVERIAQKILQSDQFPIMPLDLDYYKDSYELALIEAQNDYKELKALRNPQEELDVGELLAIISQQKKQISELRGTVRMLTMKGR